MRILDDPSSVSTWSVFAFEIGRRVIVIPADDGNCVISIILIPRCTGFRGLPEAVSGRTVIQVYPFLIPEVNHDCSVFHDRLFDGVPIGCRDPHYILHMSNVAGIGILRIKPGFLHITRFAIGERGHVFGSGAFPPHQRHYWYNTTCAAMQIGLFYWRGGISHQHAELVISVSVSEPGQMQLGQIEVSRCRSAGFRVDHTVLDHGSFYGGVCCKGPTGPVGALVFHGSDIAVVPAVVAARKLGQGLARMKIIDLLPLAAEIGLGQGAAAVDWFLVNAAEPAFYWLRRAALLKGEACRGKQLRGKNEAQQDRDELSDFRMEHDRTSSKKCYVVRTGGQAMLVPACGSGVYFTNAGESRRRGDH